VFINHGCPVWQRVLAYLVVALAAVVIVGAVYGAIAAIAWTVFRWLVGLAYAAP